ncbi:nitrate reductase molybdenum cofactor assembly chaperone [Actinokineospora auranticolor]|uniref:Nitrate reductase delta subunit n=1 Tax=Actinokineospora auranticolor TaxID=155976 RepID=A0A2S6H0W0_9PSEU|nr:nitrate reductase molybdenum cofactor assembly chaperone [Actinokineospora auranticolor]PPK71113.1 nitrate reductase delta subunit [Actinokineospora auranticolor]
MDRKTRLRHRLASCCLHYPDDLIPQVPLLRRCLAEVSAPGVEAVLDYVDGISPVAAARHYVEVFDTKANRCLHLTWYSDGDTRNRGGSLAAIKAEYRQRGYALAPDELPDYLPVLLEFAALTGSQRLLTRFRPSVAMLHRNLVALGTPYAAVVADVLRDVPERDDATPVPRAAPVERVGLEPVLLGYPTFAESHR